MCVTLDIAVLHRVFSFFFIVFSFICFFFFQAEDGIRDLVRSRGLGDVYKRQPHLFLGTRRVHAGWRLGRMCSRAHGSEIALGPSPVSYTHLTLPTSDLV